MFLQENSFNETKSGAIPYTKSERMWVGVRTWKRL